MRIDEIDTTIDFPTLANDCIEAGIVGKAIDQLSKEEVERLGFAFGKSTIFIPKKGYKFSKPYITDDGELIIPFDSDPKYHFWKPCGQSVAETLRELNAPDWVWKKYTDDPNEPF
jgi:hypothetical protein